MLLMSKLVHPIRRPKADQAQSRNPRQTSRIFGKCNRDTCEKTMTSSSGGRLEITAGAVSVLSKLAAVCDMFAVSAKGTTALVCGENDKEKVALWSWSNSRHVLGGKNAPMGRRASARSHMAAFLLVTT